MLFDRIIRQGTLEEPCGKPNPYFALPATVNWIKALRIILEDLDFSFHNCDLFYIKQGKRKMDGLRENTVLEQLFLALHHLSALAEMQKVARPDDLSRIAVLAWYYGIYHAARAMIAAQGGTPQESHSPTAHVWDDLLASHGLIMPPFSLRVDSLIESEIKSEISKVGWGVSSPNVLIS